MFEAAPIQALSDPNFSGRNVSFDVEGHQIYTQVLMASRPTTAVVFRFHGAIKRDLRTLPSFQSNLAQIRPFAHQITICDPTMMAREGFSCSWFAGCEGLDTQALLKSFCSQASAALGAKRVVYMGSSGGGFASLYLSRHHPGSIAFVTVPQTNLQRHFTPSSVRRYLEACWPSLTIDEVSEKVCLDVCPLYSGPFENSVIYVQSAGDTAHNVNQMQPFLQAVWGSGDAKKNLVLHSDFWGKMGHGGVVPPSAYLPWMKASVIAPSTDREALLQTHFTIMANDPPEVVAKEKVKTGYPPAEIRRADLLRDIALGAPRQAKLSA